MADYTKILHATNAIWQQNNPDTNKPKGSRGVKYNKIIKPILDARKAAKAGTGVIVIPHDPNALVQMLSLRMASFLAGNTGARNEIVGICDELLRQHAITRDQYKNFMSQL